MAVDPELLEILICPKSQGPLTLFDLPEALRGPLVDRYREHFRDEEPEVVQALYSPEAALVYPIVSDIPIMLIDEALAADSLPEGSLPSASDA
ncbi:MAG: Trm112 family protein [Acidobacteriota bacterium]